VPLFRLNRSLRFPPVELAEPEGILAVGGDLSVERLLLAYRSGIFPWYNEDEPIQWWAPDPRFVLFPERLRVADSLRRVVKGGRFRVTFDQDFRGVVTQCGRIHRPGQRGSWITGEMREAYVALHGAGHAHSVEVWQGEELAGGLYGVSLGRVFFGESMFARVSNASKVGFVTWMARLAEQGCRLVDCQVPTDHLRSFGAEEIPRPRFMALLQEALG
jgi:leucyl/phenylalanyl-tRNA---protein transferase